MFRDRLPPAYSALQFLLQWERHERALHEVFVLGPDLAHLRRALAYFKVARNFPGIDRQADFVLNQLDVARRSSAPVPQRVESLARKFKQRFDKNNISAASKLLWLAERSPYVIYDRRAAQALRRLGHKIPEQDYGRYFEAWRSEYEANRQTVARATHALAKARNFFPPSYEPDPETLQAPWFRERVFDLYLWESGGEA